jgi:hypothetical protein
MVTACLLYPWRFGPAYVYLYSGAGYSNCTPQYSSTYPGLLGITDNGPQIQTRFFWDRVDGDDFGGRAGPPADEQLMGAQATIDMTLTKYADLEKLEAVMTMGSTAGTLPALGSFKRMDYRFFGLKIIGQQMTPNIANIEFKMVTPVTAAWNIGTQHRKQRITFQADIDGPCSRVLYSLSTGVNACTT